MQWRDDIKQVSAGVWLALSIAFFVMGLFILCACPGIYVLSAIFAGVAYWRAAHNRRMRNWCTFFLVASLLAASAETFALIKEKRSAEMRARKVQVEQSSVPQTNHSAK